MRKALGITTTLLRRRPYGQIGTYGNFRNFSGINSEDDVPPIMSGPQRKMIDRKPSISYDSDSSWAAQQKAMADRIFCSEEPKTESQIRRDLKVAHRLVAKYGWDDLVWNHISARCSADQTEDCCDLPHNTYLITPGGMLFSEMRGEDFVFDSIEESGNILHSGIYKHRHDVKCIIHTHAPSVMAVSVLKDGFKFLIQDSAPFYNRVGYHDWEGINTCAVEQERIAQNLGPNGSVLFLRNHGAVIVGRSVQEAWVKLYYLNRCCTVQLDAMKAARKPEDIIECPKDLLIHAAAQIEKHFPHGKFEWNALRRMVET